MQVSLAVTCGRGFLVLLLATVGAGLAGCSDDGRLAPAPAPAPAPSAARPASPSTNDEIDDPPGTIACRRLVEAVADATLMQPGVVDAIVSAGATADAPVTDAAQRLATAYAAAVTAKGSDSEPDAVAAVSAAGDDMSQVCDASGLGTVG